jgi:sterol desaturase/sphingolipid hydroxylase (fatty acid hydroxylase superfamily)
VIFGSLILIALVELSRPRRQLEFPALRRRLGNLGIWLLNLLLAAFIFAPTVTFRPELETAFHVNLPSWPITNQWVSFLAAFLLLDFLNYAVHRCQHAMPFLWRFHALHHSDPDVDVTTSVRHHPIEYLIATGVYWVAVLLFDIPVMVVMSHSLTVFAAAAVTHGNIRLPEWLERLLQPMMITLDLHLVHHSIAYDEANANFGAVLSIWDRLFGTYRTMNHAQLDRIVFGVGELPRPDCVRPSAMLLSPWRLSRPRVTVKDRRRARTTEPSSR